MRPKRRAAVVAGLLGAVLAAACSKSPAAPIRPSSAFPSGTPSASTNPIPSGVIGAVPSGAIGSGGTIPSTSPGAATGNLTAGSVTFSMTGDDQVQTTLSSKVASIYGPPPSGMALVWGSGSNDPTTVGLGGLSFVGTQATSPTLTLTFVAGNTLDTFQSSAGECHITIGTAEPTHVAGSFTCTALKGTSGKTVNVTGSFDATG